MVQIKPAGVISWGHETKGDCPSFERARTARIGSSCHSPDRVGGKGTPTGIHAYHANWAPHLEPTPSRRPGGAVQDDRPLFTSRERRTAFPSWRFLARLGSQRGHTNDMPISTSSGVIVFPHLEHCAMTRPMASPRFHRSLQHDNVDTSVALLFLRLTYRGCACSEPEKPSQDR